MGNLHEEDPWTPPVSVVPGAWVESSLRRSLRRKIGVQDPGHSVPDVVGCTCVPVYLCTGVTVSQFSGRGTTRPITELGKCVSDD